MKPFLIKGNYIFFYLLVIILLVFKSTKQQQNRECEINGYNKSMINETTCKEFTYLFNNSICDFNKSTNSCLNIEEDNTENYKGYHISKYIVNNCGISGFYEPDNEGFCKNLQLVEGLCCFVKYGNRTENHTACLRTLEYEKKKGESYFKNYNYTENFNFVEIICKEKFIELWFSILFISLLFLI